jgi:hypothetical protein
MFQDSFEDGVDEMNGLISTNREENENGQNQVDVVATNELDSTRVEVDLTSDSKYRNDLYSESSPLVYKALKYYRELLSAGELIPLVLHNLISKGATIFRG